jgi:DNA-directed RNA polymerase subunit M/transcription elongation factor TFIIS
MEPVAKPCPQCGGLMTVQRNKSVKCLKCGHRERLSEGKESAAEVAEATPETIAAA